jgi:hypothetical protein
MRPLRRLALVLPRHRSLTIQYIFGQYLESEAHCCRRKEVYLVFIADVLANCGAFSSICLHFHKAHYNDGY